MSFTKYENLEKAKSELKKQGYVNIFKLENNGLMCIQNSTFYDHGQLKIAEFHRFNHKSNPLNSIMIFAIEGEDGIKGLIVSKSGTYKDIALRKFMDKVKIKFRRFYKSQNTNEKI